MVTRRSGRKTSPRAAARARPRWRVGMVATVLSVLLGVALVWLYRRPELPKRIILISIDTLRADHLGCYGYEKIQTPHIDRLAREGVLFENAATVTPLTLPAHSSIFTGRGPLHHGVIDNLGFQLDETEKTLAELLRDRGFATGGFVGSFVLDSRWGIAQGFDTYLDRFEAPRGRITALLRANQRPGDEVLGPALEWIRSQGERPYFAFIHFFDPHTPYAPPEPYREQYGPDRFGRYDGEVAFVDSLVGRLIATLEEQGLYDDALIVLMGDHGESLGEHGEETHGFFIYDATIRVPLLIKAPGIQGAGRVSGQVRTIDVMPTVLDLLGLQPPASVEGASLRAQLQDPDSDPDLLAYMESHYGRLHFGWAALRGLRSDRYKFIEAPHRELYDLRADPEETNNLSAQRQEVVAQLAGMINQLGREQLSSPWSRQAVDHETEQRLRALGYVTSSAGTSPLVDEERNDLPDPKEKIGLFNRITEARIANQVGEVDRAVDLLSSVLNEDPDVMLAYVILGNIRLYRQAYGEAEAVFQAALSRNDRSVDGTYGLALAYKGLGRLEEAAFRFSRCIELDPSQVRAVYQLAEVRVAQGRPGEAERLLRKALQGQPDTSLRLLLADVLLARENLEEALGVLRRAEKEDSGNALVHLSLGNLLLEEGDVEKALPSFRRAEALAPRDPRVFNALGNALAQRGDGQASFEAFRKAVELDPSFAPAHNNLGIALARLGRPQEAGKAFRKAIEADPRYAQAHNNLGFLYLQAGAVREAVPLFRRALALEPDYPQARSNLEAALRRTTGSQ
ncbi:MAG: sulfatase-like hydrolase/transferase [Acidobacteriota bacterium]